MQLIGDPALVTLLQVSGVVQLGVVIVSLGVPHVLKWKEESRRMSPLNHHIFWTYAAYICGTNLALAGVSLFGADWLIQKTPLAFYVSTYIALYWGARFFIQLFSYRFAEIPKGIQYQVADWTFRVLFLFLTLVFATAMLHSSEGM